MNKCAVCEKEVVGNRRKYCSSKCSETYWNRKCYAENRDKILERMRSKEYRKKEREYAKTPARRKYHCEYMKRKKCTDPVWRLKYTIWDRIRKSGLSGNSIGRVEKNLGYTIRELYEYLSGLAGYDESRYLSGELVLDHIIPYHWFLAISVGDEEFRKCWNMRNLRIIPKEKNVTRRRKQFDWEEVEQLGIVDLLPCGADVIYVKFVIPLKGTA